MHALGVSVMFNEHAHCRSYGLLFSFSICWRTTRLTHLLQDLQPRVQAFNDLSPQFVTVSEYAANDISKTKFLQKETRFVTIQSNGGKKNECQHSILMYYGHILPYFASAAPISIPFCVFCFWQEDGEWR